MTYQDDMGKDRTSYVRGLEDQIITLNLELKELKERLQRIEAFPKPPEAEIEIGGEETRQQQIKPHQKRRRIDPTGPDSHGEATNSTPLSETSTPNSE